MRTRTSWSTMLLDSLRSRFGGQPLSGQTRKAAALDTRRVSAEAGEPRAQARLGVHDGGGVGATQDHAEAVRLFREAADQGDALAKFNLGVMYADGRGVTQD
jgi:uncharacterized protein